MSCTKKISKNFARKCSYKPKAGLHPDVYLINVEDIDKASSQLSTSGMSVSSLVLNDGAKIYKAEGSGKYPQGTSNMAQGDNGANWTHGATLRLLYYGDDERAELKNLCDNGRVAVVIQKKDSGESGELTYEVLGWESGMQVSAVDWSSAENEGVVPVTLSTVEGEEESTDRKIFLDTDVATTAAWLASNTYSAA